MSPAIKDKAYQLRVNHVLFDQAKAVLEEHHYSVAAALNLFLQNVAATGEVPLLTEEELEKERLFKDLQAEVHESIARYQAGQAVTEDELREHFGL